MEHGGCNLSKLPQLSLVYDKWRRIKTHENYKKVKCNYLGTNPLGFC